MMPTARKYIGMSRQAAELATAVYCSGWAHCQHSAPRVRRLLVITMMQAQVTQETLLRK